MDSGRHNKRAALRTQGVMAGAQQEKTASTPHIHKIDLALRNRLHDELQNPLVEAHRFDLISQSIVRRTEVVSTRSCAIWS